MNANFALEKCKSFIDCQLKSAQAKAAGDPPFMNAGPVITISRQTGAGGRSIAVELAEYMQTQADAMPCPWTVFDRNLVEQILADHDLPQQLAEYMDEDKISTIRDGLGELLGLHPSFCTLVQYSIETIIRLAQMGNVIIVGRGANVITQTLPNTLHVRLIGSRARRIVRVTEAYHFTPKEAAEFVDLEDRKRRRYLKTYFDEDIENPLLYHLMINTDLMAYEDAALLIGDAMKRRLAHSPV